MSISEKELAEKLADAYGGDEGFLCVEDETDFRRVARRAAELLGVTLADGPLASGFYRHEDGQVVRLRDDSTPYNIEAHVESDWALRNRDALTPARIISEEEYTNLLAEVASLQESLDEARDLQRTFQREKDEWEANYQRLVSIRADEESNPGDAQYAPARPAELTEADLQEAWDSDETGLGWWYMDGDIRRRFRLRVHYVLAKHGGARELPGRDPVKQKSVNLMETEIQVRHAISDSLKHGLKLPLASDVSEATSRVMDIVSPLLEGGGDE